MSKSYQYVSKCSCCEDRFTRVSVPFMHVTHCSALGEIARKAMVQQGFKAAYLCNAPVKPSLIFSINTPVQAN